MGKPSREQKTSLQTVAEILGADENTPLLTDELGGDNGALYEVSCDPSTQWGAKLSNLSLDLRL